MFKDIGTSKATTYFKVKLVKSVTKVSRTQKIFVVVKFYKELNEIH